MTLRVRQWISRLRHTFRRPDGLCCVTISIWEVRLRADKVGRSALRDTSTMEPTPSELQIIRQTLDAC